MEDQQPVCRVVDATTVPDGGPAQLVVTHLPRAPEIAEKIAAARGVVHRSEPDRLDVLAGPDRLVDAAGRVGGAALAEPLRAVVDPAVAGWLHGPADVTTPVGTLPTGKRPVVVAVVNVTPDSFSDGGAAYDPDDHPAAAVRAAMAAWEAGADVLDVGGESTRPGARPVAVDDELGRVLPVVEALAGAGAVVSIDTTKAAVARAAVEAGAAIVNDVSSGSLDPDLWDAVVDLGVPYVLTHLRGEPRTMQRDPHYADVLTEVFDHLALRARELIARGLPADRLIVDPGIGFGKRLEHNLALLQATRQLTSLGHPVMIGASRKTLIGTLTGVEDPTDRHDGSVAAASVAVAAGARLVRVHDVSATVRAVRVAHAMTTAQAPDDAAAGVAGDRS